MSGIIKFVLSNKKIVGLSLLIVLGLLFFKHYFLSMIILIMFLLNYLTLYKTKKIVALFDSNSNIRNIDCLIIGDMLNIKDYIQEGKSYVGIFQPNITLISAYEILRHTFSILDENNAKVIIAVKEKNENINKYSIFDCYYFTNITVKRLGLKLINKIKCFPVLFAPLKSIVFILGFGTNDWINCKCPNKKIEDFCTERNISLTYLHK